MTGHKTVWLFAPQHHDAMTPRGACFPALLNQHRQSSLDIFHSAALSATAALRCELHAGDALLIPRSLTQLSSHAGLLCGVAAGFAVLRLTSALGCFSSITAAGGTRWRVWVWVRV